MNDMIRDKLKETVNLKDIIKTDNLRRKSKSTNCFFKDINERHLSLKDANDGQSIFAAKLKNLDEGKKTTEKAFF